MQSYLVLGKAAAKTIATSEHTEGPQLSGSWKSYLENSPVASEELRKGMQHAGQHYGWPSRRYSTHTGSVCALSSGGFMPLEGVLQKH